MTRIVILTDNNIVEGVLGLFSLTIMSYIINRFISVSKPIILGLSFIISWYFRKVGVHVYNYIKKYHKISIKPITHNIN